LLIVAAALPLGLHATVISRASSVGPAVRIHRPLGYTLFGLAIALLLGSLVLNRARTESMREILARTARAFSPQSTFEPAQRRLSGDSALEFLSATDPRVHVFGTARMAGDIAGFGGPITLAVMSDDSGTLLDFAVVKSHETPSYLEWLAPWMATLKGRSLADAGTWSDVHGVTGATLTSVAVRDILQRSGATFSSDVLGLETESPGPSPRSRMPDRRILCLGLLLVLALMMRDRRFLHLRRLVLLLVVAAAGLWLNIQYSMVQVLALLGLNAPPAGLNLAFMMVVVLPIVVLLFGNIYCGYLCPFGALQELVALLRPARLATSPDLTVWRHGRFLKYVVLFVFVALFALCLKPELAGVDPLVKMFSRERDTVMLIMAVAILALAFLFDRFWCRALCPAGAFLSLLNGVQILRRFLPRLSHKACTFGVTGAHDLDCLSCDRCRSPVTIRPIAPRETTAPRNLLYGVAVIVLGVLILHRTHSAWHQIRGRQEVAPTRAATAGQPRNIDAGRMRRLIDRGRLSDHEAMYYRPAHAIPTNAPPARAGGSEFPD